MNVTQILGRLIAESQPQRIAEPAQDEAVRALVDWLACCLGGCLEPALDAARTELATAPGEATLPGRGWRTDLISAAWLSGMAADALAFAAEHGPTGVPISAPVAAALLPLAEARAAPGAELVHAYVIGAELACRMARSLGNGDGTLSAEARRLSTSMGAAAACAKLLHLDARRVTQALDAIVADVDRAQSADPPGEQLESASAAQRGLARALGAEPDAEAADADMQPAFGRGDEIPRFLEGWGEEWELARSAYKSFPCAGALHATIEACLGARARHRALTRHVVGIELRVHPCVLARSLLEPPANAAQARCSLSHAAAVALVDGAAGREQFSGSRVKSARVAAMRQRVAVRGDASLAHEAAHVVLRLADGRSVEHAVRCARGQPARPLSDAELSAKFRDLAADVLATDQAERLLALAWNVRALGDVGALVRASVPEDAPDPAQLPGSPLLPR